MEKKRIDPTVKVLIADSQFLITEAFKSVFEKAKHYNIIAVVTEKKDILDELQNCNPDLLILDHTLVEFGSLSELKEIKDKCPGLKILVVSNSIPKNELIELNNAGVNNIILKTIEKEDFFEALEAVQNGKKYYSDELLDLLFETGDKKIRTEETGQLTPTELEIVRLIADGLTTKEIASRKFVSYHTVISHRKNIFRKLGVTSISELIMYSIKAGWISSIEYNI